MMTNSSAVRTSKSGSTLQIMGTASYPIRRGYEATGYTPLTSRKQSLQVRSSYVWLKPIHSGGFQEAKVLEMTASSGDIELFEDHAPRHAITIDDLGWAPEYAAHVRGLLAAFAEDWDDPIMDVYNDENSAW